MKCFIGFGSNLRDRRENLERAANSVAALSQGRSIRVSPVYETSAMVPDGAPADWRQPYLNAVVEMEWAGSAVHLLKKLKDIEGEFGRSESPRWAPRVIDLDLLLFGNEVIHETDLQVPHPGISQRSFVLDPLKDLSPLLRIPGLQEPALLQARKLDGHYPWVMAILNLTPDSFSDYGQMPTVEETEARLDLIEKSRAQAIDFGAESTRPGAQTVSQDEERRRLEPVLDLLRTRYRGVRFHPFVSVDTRRPEIAALALSYGVDCINDVSGLSDPKMLDVLAENSCDYILTHSLTVPADLSVTMPLVFDPVTELKSWLNQKLEVLNSKGVDTGRIIFDPGIGFGKTPDQSISILKRINEFAEFPVRLLYRRAYVRGHSVNEKA